MHDYNVSDFTFWNEEDKKSYLETKKVNTKFYEDNIELYNNGQKKVLLSITKNLVI